MSNLNHIFTISLIIYLTSLASAINCPQNCKCAWVLDSLGVDCSHKSLTEYPLFSDLPIENLDLSGNNLEYFPTQLADVESLIYLDLSNNKITYLEANALLGFTALRVLLLANNSFNSWLDLNPSEVFQNAISLLYLNLNGNNLETFTDLKSKEMLNSESLVNLKIENCGITTVGGNHLIHGLPSLDRLSLSGNAISTLNNIPSNTLRVLELSDCSLLSIPPTLIEGLPNLKVLNVSWNFALSFKDAIESESLADLDASFCNLDVINLSGFSSLTDVYLRGNMLRTLDQYTFSNNTLLETVDLARNSLRNILPDAFTKLKRLSKIDLSYNEIARLDNNLFQVNDVLISIDISRNVIERFSKLASNSLRDINFSGCEIIIIDEDALTGLPAIQRLDLSKTLIKEFPSNMRSKTLRKLDLRNCKLTAIRNTTFSGFPELSWLYLSGNRFTNPISPSFFRWNQYLDTITISDNPWICNCYDSTFMDFYDYLMAAPQKLKECNNVRCASPSYFYGMTWEDACSNVWTPNGRTSSAERAWTVIMWSMLVIAVGACVYACFKKYMRKRKQRRNRNEYRQNRDEMMEIRAQNQRMLEEAGTPNAPNSFENNLPTYEDAIRMPKLERPIKSMVDLTESGHMRRAKLRRSQTESGEIEDDGLLLDDRQRFRSEEMLSNRTKERTARIVPFSRTGYVEYSNSRSRRLSIEDSRFPAAHLKSQNLQSAEKIANFQGYEHSPYTRRRQKLADIPPFKRATMRTDSVEFLTDPEYEDQSKPGSPFARRKPKTPPSTTGDTGADVTDRMLPPAVEDYFGSPQKSHSSSLDDSDFQIVVEPEISSIAEVHNTSSADGTSANVERGRRKKRLNSTSRRASGNFTAAAAAAGESSSSSDTEPIVVVHKAMRETLF